MYTKQKNRYQLCWFLLNGANSKIITGITENHSQFFGARIATIILFQIIHDKP